MDNASPKKPDHTLRLYADDKKVIFDMHPSGEIVLVDWMALRECYDRVCACEGVTDWRDIIGAAIWKGRNT